MPLANDIRCVSRIAVLSVVLIFSLLAHAKDPSDQTDYEKAQAEVSALIESGEGGRVTKEQAYQYFLTHSDPTDILSKIEALAKANNGVVTLAQIQKLKEDQARKKAEDFVDYGNGKYGTKTSVEGYLSDTDPKFKKAYFQDPVANVFGGKLHLAKSSTVVQDSAAPAQFSWAQASQGQTYFSVDAALRYDAWYNHFPREHLSLAVAPSLEAHTSTDPKASQDSLSAKVPLEIVVNSASLDAAKPDKAFLVSNYISIAPTFEMDQKAKTETYGANILYSPTIPVLGIGAPLHLDDHPLSEPQSQDGPPLGLGISAAWRPYVGFELGDATQSSPSLLTSGDYERFVLQLHGDIFFTRYFQVTGDFYHRIYLSDGPFLKNNPDSLDYGEISPIVWLDPEYQHFSLGMTFKDGRSTPKFTNVESLTVWLGLKF